MQFGFSLKVSRFALGSLFIFTLFLLFSCTKEREKSIELKDFVVNMADKGENRFLKLKMKLVVNNSSVISEIASQDAKISDALITFLSSKTVADLSTTMGKKVLKRQLMDLFNNKLLKSGDVTDIYFVNFVIQ